MGQTKSSDAATTVFVRQSNFVQALKPDLGVSLKDVYNAISLLIIAVAVYAGLYLSIGKPFLPDSGPAWAIIFIWFCALVLGTIVDRFQIPGPLGMIVAGIILRNVHEGHVIQGLFTRPNWSKEFRGIALAIIFLRSGLELDLGIFKRVGPAAVRLLLIPGICEAFFDGGIAVALFGMPVTFAFALGFILKAVGPALVIQCMFEVQQRRLGLRKAIPATVVAAASFDDAIAITGYTIFINIAVTGQGSKGWKIARGPVSIVLGILGGLVFAFICAQTKLWNNAYKRTSVVFISALIMKFFFDKYEFTSGGALGSLTLGLVVKEFWTRGWPAIGCVEGEHGAHLARSVEKHIRWFWRFIMCPLLFGLIGTTIYFKSINSGTIPKSVAIIFAGLAVRAPITFLVMCKSGFNWKEKLFFAFAWTPKATVQAALSALPRDQVNRAFANHPPSLNAEYRQYQQWADDALVTAVFCILICGSLGTILIRWFSGVLLEKTPEPEDGTERPASPRALEEMRRSVSGAYKNPATDALHPFGSDSRPAHGLADAASLEQERAEKAQLKAHNSLLAGYLDQFDSIAEEVDGKGLRKDDTYLTSTAQRLKSNVRQLRHKLIEESGVTPPPQEVEGADAFMRASRDLRHRQPSEHNGPGQGLP